MTHTHEAKHTPTPWTWAGYACGNEPANFSILTKDTHQQPGSEREERIHLADVYSTPHDAAHIVHCVNTHDALVEAVKLACLVMAKGAGLSYKDRQEAHEACIAALAQAEKGA